jgi:hypothetical protein
MPAFAGHTAGLEQFLAGLFDGVPAPRWLLGAV